MGKFFYHCTKIMPTTSFSFENTKFQLLLCFFLPVIFFFNNWSLFPIFRGYVDFNFKDTNSADSHLFQNFENSGFSLNSFRSCSPSKTLWAFEFFSQFHWWKFGKTIFCLFTNAKNSSIFFVARKIRRFWQNQKFAQFFQRQMGSGVRGCRAEVGRHVNRLSFKKS